MPNSTEPTYLYLTTIGRRTGLPREIEIWFTRTNGCYYVIAEYPTSHWVQNVTINAQVRVRLGANRFAATARVVDPDAEPGLHGAVQQLSKEKYGWGEGVMVELKPQRVRRNKLRLYHGSVHVIGGAKPHEQQDTNRVRAIDGVQ